MIQRIQTVYLAISVLLMAATLLTPWAVYEVDGKEFGAFDLLHLAMSKAVLTVPVLVLTLCTLGLSVIAIFLFRDRKRQMRFTRFALWFCLLTFSVFALLHYQAISRANEVGEVSITYSFVAVLPLLAAVLLWLAYKAIKKDEELIRSVDRLR